MPMVSVLPSARLRPTGLGWYFSSAAAARTRAAISGSTVKLPFMTRETVACETPAFTATSAMPILPVADFLTMGTLPSCRGLRVPRPDCQRWRQLSGCLVAV